MSRVELAKISALTFYKDSLTEARRTKAIPQLICVGKPCKLYTPEVQKLTLDSFRLGRLNGIMVDSTLGGPMPIARGLGNRNRLEGAPNTNNLNYVFILLLLKCEADLPDSLVNPLYTLVKTLVHAFSSDLEGSRLGAKDGRAQGIRTF
jgi:hypothetical protein